MTFLDALDRAHNGPYCEPSEWDKKIIPGKVKEKVHEHGLEKVCTPEDPVNTDDSLADEFWKASFEFAVDVGMLCLDTKRVIKFTEEELKEVLRNARAEVTLGEGLDRVVARHRVPEDPWPPTTFLGEFDTVTTEELFPLAVASVAQYKAFVDVLIGPTIETVYGRELRSGTPYETLGGKREATLVRQGLSMAHRPGMSAIVPVTSPTEYGLLGAYGIAESARRDWAAVLPITSLKTNYGLLQKVAQLFNCGCLPICSAHYSMLGGYERTPEGCVVSTTAGMILTMIVHQATLIQHNVFDFRNYVGHSSREALWANGMSLQAQNRNAKAVTMMGINPTGGPCTDMLLYEAASHVIDGVVSGCAITLGLRPRMGKYPNYFSGLESCFSGEVTKASAGIKRIHANEILKQIIPKFEDKTKDPPAGKPFWECTDLQTLQPTKEWLDIYLRVKKELIDLGLPLTSEYPETTLTEKSTLRF